MVLYLEKQSLAESLDFLNRHIEKTMGHKKVCLECKVTFNRPFDSGSKLTYPCPKCGKEMKLLPHRFRPPKKNEDKKWETDKFLIDNGIYFQNIYENETKTVHGVIKSENLVSYPENIRDAKEFVEKHKNQARQ